MRCGGIERRAAHRVPRRAACWGYEAEDIEICDIHRARGGRPVAAASAPGGVYAMAVGAALCQVRSSSSRRPLPAQRAAWCCWHQVPAPTGPWPTRRRAVGRAVHRVGGTHRGPRLAVQSSWRRTPRRPLALRLAVRWCYTAVRARGHQGRRRPRRPAAASAAASSSAGCCPRLSTSPNSTTESVSLSLLSAYKLSRVNPTPTPLL